MGVTTIYFSFAWRLQVRGQSKSFSSAAFHFLPQLLENASCFSVLRWDLFLDNGKIWLQLHSRKKHQSKLKTKTHT
jgi:hypothetical protein